MPLVHEAGKEAEVDWYEAEVEFPWGREVVGVFEMRACYSGREFHMGFPHQTQQVFLEAHTEAFAHFGGVFARLRYDNLKAAVTKVLLFCLSWNEAVERREVGLHGCTSNGPTGMRCGPPTPSSG
ncbi:MAG TPA: hypothetical protein VFH51_06910 [Myxococcota bacterium]|nr:hypothetical protein [Myxococcota bacterium]